MIIIYHTSYQKIPIFRKSNRVNSFLQFSGQIFLNGLFLDIPNINRGFGPYFTSGDQFPIWMKCKSSDIIMMFIKKSLIIILI
jgi:hypothetical protein